MTVLNWQIIKHPMNWLTLFLMVFIGAIAVHLILTHLTGMKRSASKNG